MGPHRSVLKAARMAEEMVIPALRCPIGYATFLDSAATRNDSARVQRAIALIQRQRDEDAANRVPVTRGRR